jgi:hypothetical protein
MISDDVLLAELTRHAVLCGKMEFCLKSLASLLTQPMIEPNRWHAVSMINQCLEDCRHVLPVKLDAKLTTPAARPNGEDKSQGTLALPAPKAASAAERRRAVMSSALKRLNLPG